MTDQSVRIQRRRMARALIREGRRKGAAALKAELRRDDDGPSRPKRRSLSAEARREAILGAALEEFTARGYEGARLDDVAQRAGVAKGTIYLYFTDKQALFQDLVRSMADALDRIPRAAQDSSLRLPLTAAENNEHAPGHDSLPTPVKDS